MSTVPVFDPQGTLRDVPQEQLADAVRAGGMPAVRFQAPDKSVRFVPANRTSDAVNAGGKILPMEQQDVQHPGFWSTLYDDVKGMAQGATKTASAGAQAITGNPVPAAEQAADTAQTMGENMQHRRDEGRSLPYRTIAPVGEALGVNVRGMEDAADQGNPAAVLGHAAAVPAVMAATEGIVHGAGPVADVARPALAKAAAIAKAGASAAKEMATVENAATVIGGAAGAKLGALAGEPFGGGAAGAYAGRLFGKKIGTQLADALSKKSSEFPTITPDDVEGVTSSQVQHAGEVSEQIPAESITSQGSQPALAPKPNTSPKAVQQQIENALGGRPLVRNVSLKDQIAASTQKLPDDFTPVDSSVLRGYKYDPAAREFSSVTNAGQQYIHGDVSPEEVQAFEDADSKGKAWNQLRSQNPQVAKVINGKRVATKPITRGNIPEGAETLPGGTMQAIQDSLPQSQAPKFAPTQDVGGAIKRTIVTDPETGRPEFSDVVAAKRVKKAPAQEDLSDLLKQSLAQVRARKAQ